jgi:hypothetical protein
MTNRFLDIQGKPISTELFYQIKEDGKGEWPEEKYRLDKYIGNSAHFIGDNGGEFVLTCDDTPFKVRSLEELSVVSQSLPKCTIEKS